MANATTTVAPSKPTTQTAAKSNGAAPASAPPAVDGSKKRTKTRGVFYVSLDQQAQMNLAAEALYTTPKRIHQLAVNHFLKLPLADKKAALLAMIQTPEPTIVTPAASNS